MKKLYIAICVAALTLTLNACGCSRQTEETAPVTTVPETQETTTMPAPTIPPIKPNVPEETEGRGSTDDTTDAPNETLPEEIDRMRRRIMD